MPAPANKGRNSSGAARTAAPPGAAKTKANAAGPPKKAGGAKAASPSGSSDGAKQQKDAMAKLQAQAEARAFELINLRVRCCNLVAQHLHEQPHLLSHCSTAAYVHAFIAAANAHSHVELCPHLMCSSLPACMPKTDAAAED